MNLLRKYFIYVIFFLITVFVISIWFHSGTMYAGGEEGIPFYNPTRMFQLYKSFWYETGTGFLIPVNIPRALLFYFFSLTQSSSWIAQALIYYFLIFTAFCSCYLLTKRLTNNWITSFFASLFYFFNLYAMSQVWGRFLLTNMFAWSYLPLSLYLWVQIIEEKKIQWIGFFLLSSIIYVYSFGMPAMLITIWIPLFIFLLYKVILIKDDLRGIRSILSISFLTMFLWFFLNIWWLFPYIKLSNASFSSLTNAQSNLDSLAGVSQFFPTQELLLLRQSYLFGKESIWFSFYSNAFIYVIGIAVLCITLYGAFTLRKYRYYGFLITLFISAWFLSKGTNPPFGTLFYSFLFHFFSFTTSLRNSYEKIGIIFLLPYAIFFGFGVNQLFKKFNRFAVLALVSIFLVIYVWPLWTGFLYNHLSVTIPNYYAEANAFLNKQPQGRLLIVPIISGDSVQYKWGSESYTGLEPSEFLFDKPAISKILRTDYFDNAYLSLYNAFINKKDYDKFLQSMDIKYIILHNDMNTIGYASTAAQTKEALQKNPYIKFVKRFGKLDIFSYSTSVNLFTASGNAIPNISAKKVTNTQYKVSIKNAKKPYNLIFRETFNPLWQAKIDGKLQSKHTVYDGVINLWHINNKGSYVIYISLKPL